MEFESATRRADSKLGDVLISDKNTTPDLPVRTNKHLGKGGDFSFDLIQNLPSVANNI